VGQTISFEQGRLAAQTDAINALSRIHPALSGFDRLASLLPVAGHVASASDFFDSLKFWMVHLAFSTMCLAKGGAIQGLPTRPGSFLNASELEITFAYQL